MRKPAYRTDKERLAVEAALLKVMAIAVGEDPDMVTFRWPDWDEEQFYQMRVHLTALYRIAQEDRS